MAKRSLQASAEGIRKAKQAFRRKGWTQEYLAGEVGLETRQPIWKFFTGKAIDRQVFHEICLVLGLNPEEIAQQPPDESLSLEKTISENTPDIDALVQKARFANYEKIQAQCGTLHLLDIARPIVLDDLYVEVDIFEEITSKRWLEINDLQRLDSNNFDRFNLDKFNKQRIPGLEAVAKYSKLMVFGKTGSGKTTFLQSLAVRCNQGKFKSDCLPIFIRLKNLAENTSDHKQISLLQYIYQEFSDQGISISEILTIFAQGKALILLDSLDELNEEESDIIIREIHHFSERFYKNTVIITCRLAAQRYQFNGFTEIEIADFSKSQIITFADKWFVAVAKNSLWEGKAKASEFIKKLELPENQQILELATTPILLNLTCLVFQFLGDFPALRSELYKQALELLLVHWDEARRIRRDEFYRNLSLLDKIKLLCRLAATTFTEGDYFFPATKIQPLITEYLRQLPHASTDPEALQLDSTAALKAIEAQHGLLLEQGRGIYSFSHLTFQEYLTAREIVAAGNSQTLQNFVTHIGEKRWREVFLLAAGMMQTGDELLLLMKQEVDNLVISNQKLQKFVKWLDEKTSIINASYYPASVRAFYFTLALPPDYPLAYNQNLALSLDSRLSGNLAIDLALDLALIHALAISLRMTTNIFYQRLSAIALALDLQHLLQDRPVLQQSLQNLHDELPTPEQSRHALKSWWEENGETWTSKLRNLIISDRQIGHDWQFDENELQILQQYWNANKVLIDCLNNAGNVSLATIKSIEKKLFLIDRHHSL
ncbi:NACHT domain-containing protein [Fischerella thermalis]|uniref:NACHT domain-containing protein n=1 Tax=Fischerella thermalis TaxID=372787 RepID=UPI000C800142|nr:NACHT domain-containing NTPase [Fischerella thermalis]PLZ83028.1 histidine kinase [Fischerella thermalis WC217]PLZ07909.1 histidine kinase [Fischerella thermalis WC114]PLZ08555.1 histidine kinase [Fischerella thermalis WC119]PLZ13074.1 histidine kinase [Fischerella thermalis WC1110]PLZ23473.1 histidine kinase [Fischerella thermalis WC157]